MADPLPSGPDTALSELMARLAQVSEQRASFSETKVLAALTRPLRASGELFYRRPSHLEKLTTEPQPEKLVLDGNRLMLAEADEPVKTIDLNSEPVIRALVDAIRGILAGDLVALRRSYAISMAGNAAGWRLTLLPSDPRVAQVASRIMIDGTGTTLTLIQFVQTNGDQSRMTITALH